ncbi:Mov34/MPN/PAD-1 family protein [Confluentibacter sediminis]|uniref:Mov34/MPN/PAD-1 family protein n=1 Tax=Confluentibacter sediminis TaxID=2219045 RepID=UPI000DAC23A4|nr:Mov34/MPN/PAD-1 family protein [Confluentibacter sediminis]
MKLRLKDIALELQVEERFINELARIGKAHYPNEYGGFLIGYYSDDKKILTITDTILPKKYNATPSLFMRDNIGVKQHFKNFYKEKPKKYYVGEWHTHPNNKAIPSITDIKAINSIRNDKDVAILNPVLLIIGYTDNHTEIGFYVLIKDKIYKYEN